MSAVRTPTRPRPTAARPILVAAALVALIGACGLARLMLGPRVFLLGDLWLVATGQATTFAAFSVLQDRLPALVAAALAGIGLSLAGALYQRLLGNPLASPDIIGIGYGASAATVIGMLVLGWSGLALAGAALLGAVMVAAAIMLLAASRAGGFGDRLVLAGIAIGAMLAGVVQFLVSRADVRVAQGALRWLSGDVTGVAWLDLAILAGGVGVLAVAAGLLSRPLAVLELGDDTARSLGVRAGAVRIAVIAVGAALTAVVVAFIGPLAFVALMAHPLARRLGGGRGGLALTALTGAALTVAADLASAHLFGLGSGVPAGLVTGALGAPFLLWQLARTREARA